MQHRATRALQAVLLVLPVLLPGGRASGQVPRLVPFQAALTTHGQPASGSLQVTFSIYGAPSGGTALWTESKTVTVVGGSFATVLGDTTAGGLSGLAFDRTYYLGIAVGADAEMTPRRPFGAVPYALALPNVVVDAAGNVGIGTPAPTARLQVSGNVIVGNDLKVDDAGLNGGSLSPGLRLGAGNSGEGIASRRQAGTNIFGLDLFTAFLPRLSITNGGYVGIGTQAPTRPLQVVSGAQALLELTGSHAAGTWLNLSNQGTGGKTWSILSTGPSNGEGAGNLLLYDSSDSRPAVILQSGGNVGIGTTQPTSRLEVGGGDLKVSTAGRGVVFPDNTTMYSARSLVPSGAYIVSTSPTPPPGYYSGAERLSGLDGDFWVPKPFMTQPRSGAAAVALGGRVYTFGGGSNAVDMYNPGNDTWTNPTTMPESHSYHVAAAVNSKVYILGGGTNTLEYNPLTAAWTTKAPIPTARRGSAGAVINGKIYVAGGRLSTGDATGVLEVYDPSTNTWQSKAPMPLAREGASGVALNGKLVVLGGRALSDTSTVQVYDPATDTWSQLPPLWFPRSYGGAAVWDGRIYMVGGVNTNLSVIQWYHTVEEFDPNVNRWVVRAGYNFDGRDSLAVTVLDGVIYMMGGEVGYTAQKLVEAYIVPKVYYLHVKS